MIQIDSPGIITRIEPAGAGGASGACFNCDATYLGRGRKVAPQSPLEESATTSARWARKCSASPTAIAPRTPFWSVFFVKTELYVHRPAPKVGPKKVAQTDRQTDRQTESGRSGAAPGPCSGQSKRRYRSQMAQKVVPKSVSESS